MIDAVVEVEAGGWGDGSKLESLLQNVIQATFSELKQYQGAAELSVLLTDDDEIHDREYLCPLLKILQDEYIRTNKGRSGSDTYYWYTSTISIFQ